MTTRIAACIGMLSSLCLLYTSLGVAQPLDLLPYFPTQPGTIMQFASTNHQTGTQGVTTIQIAPRQRWCGLVITPWVFTKTHPDLYWAPGMDSDLFWYVVAPDSYSPDSVVLNTALWVAGASFLDRSTGALVGEHLYQTDGSFAPYMLLPKLSSVPAELRAEGTQNIHVGPLTGHCPTPLFVGPRMPTDVQESWWVRWRLMPYTTPTDEALWPYHGEALVLDFVETAGPTIVPAPWTIREQWWVAPAIGLLRIEGQVWVAPDAPAPGELDGFTIRQPQTTSLRLKQIGNTYQGED